MLLPRKLVKGDNVTVLSPSFAIQEAEIASALALLENWGLQIEIGKSAFSHSGLYAGTDEERCSDLQFALNDPDCKAIFCTRGGYGLHRIIDRLDFSHFKKSTKWILGFSDITLLHFAISTLDIASIHGPVLRQMAKHPALEKGLYDILFHYANTIDWQLSKNSKALNTTAPLVGGNLTLISTSIGTPFQLNTKDKILFIEEVGEAAYRIDRMIQHLRLAGYFQHEKAIILGSSTHESDDKPILTAEMLTTFCQHIPILTYAPIGHTKLNEALVHGASYQLLVADNKASLTLCNGNELS